MATYKLLLLAGDGIGPEVMAEVKKLITWMNAHGMGSRSSRSRARPASAGTTPSTG